MAVDKKSDYYTGAEGYSDLEGQSRRFTYIDHDVKTKFYIPQTTEEITKLKEDIRKYHMEKIDEVLAMPAINAVAKSDPFLDSTLYNEFVTRSPEGVKWDEQMVRNTLSIDSQLTDNLHRRVWRYTVPEQYWFEELSHEEMIEGSKWREWANITS